MRTAMSSWQYLSFDSFGTRTQEAITFGYTGREHDPDTGLMYYRARWLKVVKKGFKKVIAHPFGRVRFGMGQPASTELHL